MADAGRILIMPKGTYDSVIPYEKLDLVKHNDSVWLAKKDSIGIEPSDANTEYWFRMTSGANASSLGGKSAEEWQAEIDAIVNGNVTVGNADKLDGKSAEEFLQTTGGTLSGTLSTREYLNVYADSSNAETYSSVIQYMNGTRLRHHTDDSNFDDVFIQKGKLSYGKMDNGTWSENEILHTGNSASVTVVASATEGATTSLANGTIVFSKE